MIHVVDAIPQTADGEAAAPRMARAELGEAARVRFVVVGAGAIGAYVGAALARGGSEVDADRARRAPRGDAGATACRCSARAATSRRMPPATDDLDAVADADVVFLGLKAYSLPELAPRIGETCAGDTAVIAGAERHPLVVLPVASGPARGHCASRASIPAASSRARSIRARVIGCVIYCSTEIVEPGVIRHIEGTRFAIGEPDGSESERCRAISERVQRRRPQVPGRDETCATRSG